MELEVLRHQGIPETSIVSIRAGGTRRQAQLSQLDRPLKFPSGPESVNTFKIDVLDLLGTARLAYNPTESEYCLTLDPAGDSSPPNMELVFCVRRPGEAGSAARSSAVAGKDAEGAEGDAATDDEKTRDQKKEMAAREYLDKHGLTTFMQFLMQSLMKDKPADPYSFLQKQVTKRMVTELSRNVAGEKVEIPDDKGLEKLITTFTSKAPASVTPEQLAVLEREAAAAGAQLRADNARLRETAEQLKNRYGQLLQETAMLQMQTTDEGGSAPAGPQLPPAMPGESPQLIAYREIAQMQDEVSHLAKENADLVAQLATMRSSIDAVRGEIDDMGKNVPQAA
mmetsp:Transcript_81091/g.241623  ORF Transcript_81091/g.241623 Transcript_81091/m.241623 type:complete len:339 (-) Transcript_81091:108-1124(-)